MARNQSSDLRRNLYGNKIFKKILNKMRNSTLLCRRALLWIASKMLEILTRILRRISKL